MYLFQTPLCSATTKTHELPLIDSWSFIQGCPPHPQRPRLRVSPGFCFHECFTVEKVTHVVPLSNICRRIALIFNCTTKPAATNGIYFIYLNASPSPCRGFLLFASVTGGPLYRCGLQQTLRCLHFCDRSAFLVLYPPFIVPLSC